MQDKEKAVTKEKRQGQAGRYEAAEAAVWINDGAVNSCPQEEEPTTQC
jgi:hypothetical protein